LDRQATTGFHQRAKPAITVVRPRMIKRSTSCAT
jgi:hypothetical protein